ncbi:MAG: hypothetical protein ACI9SE_000839 [Neolewinella sp.]|jgi:hypothetical protein
MREPDRTKSLLGPAAILVMIAPVLVGPLAAEASFDSRLAGAPVLSSPVLSSPVLGSQIPGSQNPAIPPGVQLPGRQNPASAPPNLPGQLLGGGGGAQGGQQGSTDEFSSIWSVPSAPTFQGFATFPSRLPGYGSYPLPVNQATGASPVGTALSNPFIVPLAPAEPEPSGWPTWIRTQAKKPLPFAVDLGLLIRQDGRIWHRDQDSDPFEPLLHYSKFASLPIGAEVETRGAASFEVVLHDSTRVQARGLTAMKVISLDEQMVHIAFTNLTWLRLSASGRTNRFTLPDGSTIEFIAAPPPTVDFAALFGGLAGGLATPSELPRAPSLEIRRANEPSWYGGRATMTNFGGADIIWKHAFGTTIIKPDHRVTMFLTKPNAPTSADLAPGDSRVQRAIESVTCISDMATEVQWCGAKIQLPKGAKVTLESLGGTFVDATKVLPVANETPTASSATAADANPNAAKSPAGN